MAQVHTQCTDHITHWKGRAQTYTLVNVFAQVTTLQSQVQMSETLLQDLQKSFSQSQNAVQSRLVSDDHTWVWDNGRDDILPARNNWTLIGKYKLITMLQI